MLGNIAACLLLVYLLLYFIIYPIILYFRDPKGLRKYPNLSLFSGITNVPYMIESSRGRRSERLAELHQKHPIIRIGPNSLSFGACEAIKDIYGHATKCTKDEMYNVLAGTHFHVADVIDKHDHARKRKMLSSAYAIKNIEDWEHKIAEKISRVVEHFDCCAARSAYSPFDIDVKNLKVDYRAWTNFFTMDAIADIGLSEDLGFTQVGDDKIVSEELDGTTRLVHYRETLHSLLTVQSHIVWSYKSYPYLEKLTRLMPTYWMLWQLGDSYTGIVYYLAKKRFARYQAGERLDDFFQALMETKAGLVHNLEWGEIIAELSVMLNAGSVSTAIAISNVMYLLLKNPRPLAILREELDANLGDEVVAPYDKVKHLPYLRACIDEAMRIYPPTPFNLPRRTPEDGTSIMGEFIEGGTSVGMSAYVAHRDASIFPDPETFYPERWLQPGSKDLQRYFLTFSAGARGCLGRNISYLEQYMITATMVHRYEFTLPNPSWEQERHEHFNQIPGPLPLLASRRKLQAST